MAGEGFERENRDAEGERIACTYAQNHVREVNERIKREKKSKEWDNLSLFLEIFQKNYLGNDKKRFKWAPKLN